MPGPNKANTRSNSNSQESLSMDEKLDLLLKDVGQIKLDNQKYGQDILELREELRTFKNDVNNSVEFCNNRVSDCKVIVDELTVSTSADHTMIERLQADNKVLTSTVKELKRKLTAQDEYGRCNNLVIHGVPEAKNENIINVVKRVAAALNFKIEDNMLDAAHRLTRNPAKPGEPRSIILKFCRRFDMEELRRKSQIKKSICASELGFSSESKVFVNLAMSKETRALWMAVQSFKRRHDYKYAWITSSRRILLRRKDGDRVIHVADKADLEALE